MVVVVDSMAAGTMEGRVLVVVIQVVAPVEGAAVMEEVVEEEEVEVEEEMVAANTVSSRDYTLQLG